MQQFIVEMSKYILVLCMSFYTLDALLIFLHRNEQDGGFLYIRQAFWIFVIQLGGFYNLAVLSRDWEYVYMYIVMQVLLVLILCVTSLVYKRINRLLLNNMCMLLGVGMIMISRLNMDKAIRQFKIIAVSYIIAMFVPIIVTKCRFISKLTWCYAIMGLIPLSLVLLLGETTLGSKLSFTIQGVTFQPSEMVKVMFVLFLAASLSKNATIGRVLLTGAVAAAHVGILVLSKDLGSALIFFVAFLLVLFVASGSYIYLLAGIIAALGASLVAYHIFDHVKIRILAWTNPWTFIDNQGYQITQSLFAIGSGSWFGMGLYQGVPDDIPYVEEDFIFSSICEEFGALLGMCLLLVILSCFIMMIKIALKCKKPFYRLAAFGFGIVYIFQIFLTVGGSIRFIPITGVTLPLVSYGGSSMVTTMIMFFVLQGIYMVAVKEGEKFHEGKENLKQRRERADRTIESLEEREDFKDEQDECPEE